MKHLMILFTLGMALASQAQVETTGTPAANQRSGFPITITVFSESVSLPNFRNIFKNGHLGARIGTEFYYSTKGNHQLIQTLNLSFYSHKDLHNALSLTSEFGYRRFFGNAFADGSIGAGYMLIKSAMPRYENVNGDFVKTSAVFGRVVPTLGVGAGYQFKGFSAFTRYEMFGEVPFGFKGVPALPHKTVHLGTRINIK